MDYKLLAQKLSKALDDLVDGESVSDLQDNSGFNKDRCQEILDLNSQAKELFNS